MSRVIKEKADGVTKYDLVARALDQFSDKIASATSCGSPRVATTPTNTVVRIPY